jgi:Tol biopolymer transport system component
MPDGNLLSQNLDSEFSSITPNGKRRVTLFKDQVFPGDFSLCRNGPFLVFGRSAPGDSVAIWRMNFTTHNLKQLTEGHFDLGPDCSPDGQSVIYTSENASPQLRRIPIDGGTPAMLSDKEVEVEALRYSPDGRQVADLEDPSSDVTQLGERLIVRNSQTGQKLKSFDLPAGFDIPWNSVGRQLRWTADGRAVTYFLQKGAAVNLWSQSLSGGPPRQITNFPDAIVAYDWSPDGKQLALTRSTQSRDVLLISHFH